MADSGNYYQDRNIKNLDKIDELLDDLPYFCEDFFRGVEGRTSPLTRLNYAYDLRILVETGKNAGTLLDATEKILAVLWKLIEEAVDPFEIL